MLSLIDSLETLSPRIQKTKKNALKRLGIETVRDLLYYFPNRYENVAEIKNIIDVVAGEKITIIGTISKLNTGKTLYSKRAKASALLTDKTGEIRIQWFAQPYMAKMIPEGSLVSVSGTITGKKNIYIANPTIRKYSRKRHVLTPVYSETRHISSLWLQEKIKLAFAKGALKKIIDPIPQTILDKYHLPSLTDALIWIHTPQKKEHALAARKRFAFEEVFLIQVLMHQKKEEARKEKALQVSVDKKKLSEFIQTFPFTPTNSQTKAIDSIIKDFVYEYPMMRLLEGDVGSGKTAVAAATTYMVATSRPHNQDFGNLQVAYMVPTEILAKQHFASFIEYFKEHPLPIGLITGKECYKYPSKVRGNEATRISRVQLLKWVANGEIPILIGTHALIQKTVEFENLAYVIIDEQHRFGKVQRQKLLRKDNVAPHLLSMTATPIPRTLALTIYGDLDLTVIDEMPKGRKSIITKIVTKQTRASMYESIRKELEKGRQAYVICPRVNEPDPTKESALLAKSVISECAILQEKIFPEYMVSFIHGKMTPQEKEEIMNKFEAGDINVLVATSVIEVGVNVPNATVILIEGAERFGLAQLHQLRGRVIRSNHQAYCFVYPESQTPKTRDRLKALTTAKNGFELAEYDMQIRGGGALYGKKQWGVSDVAMEAIQNIKMVEAARTEARNIIEKDPMLKKHNNLKEQILKKAEILHFE